MVTGGDVWLADGLGDGVVGAGVAGSDGASALGVGLGATDGSEGGGDAVPAPVSACAVASSSDGEAVGGGEGSGVGATDADACAAGARASTTAATRAATAVQAPRWSAPSRIGISLHAGAGADVGRVHGRRPVARHPPRVARAGDPVSATRARASAVGRRRAVDLARADRISG